MSKTTNYENNSIFPNTVRYRSKYVVWWVGLCPPKKACCDSKPQAIRTLSCLKIVVTRVISWDEVTLEQGRPVFWFGVLIREGETQEGERLVKTQTHPENALWRQRLQLQAKRCRRLAATSGNDKPARGDSAQRITALQLPWLLTSPELLREVSVLLSHTKYWYLDHGLKLRILRVKNCVITGQSK